MLILTIVAQLWGGSQALKEVVLHCSGADWEEHILWAHGDAAAERGKSGQPAAHPHARSHRAAGEFLCTAQNPQFLHCFTIRHKDKGRRYPSTLPQRYLMVHKFISRAQQKQHVVAL